MIGFCPYSWDPKLESYLKVLDYRPRGPRFGPTRQQGSFT